MPVAQVTWLGLSAAIFVIWIWMLCRLVGMLCRNAGPAAAMPSAGWLNKNHRRDDVRPAQRAILIRLITLTGILLILNALGLLIWPP